MKSVILSLVILMGFQSAMAQNTVAVVEQAKTINMVCLQNDNILRIAITSLATPDAETGELKQSATAVVAIRKESSRKIVATVQLAEGSFSAGGTNVKAWMKIPILGLDLNECGVTGAPPNHGGFSIGN